MSLFGCLNPYILETVDFFTLTLIWVGFLGVRFEAREGGGGGGKITPTCLKLVRIMLET